MSAFKTSSILHEMQQPLVISCIFIDKCAKGCPFVYMPVCGSDGNSYSNDCLLEIATCESDGAVTKISDGMCPPPSE